jgi:hypothetical protein
LTNGVLRRLRLDGFSLMIVSFAMDILIKPAGNRKHGCLGTRQRLSTYLTGAESYSATFLDGVQIDHRKWPVNLVQCLWDKLKKSLANAA